MPPRLGIIGVGELAEFVLRGLRGAGDTREVILSPRNAARSALLATMCKATVASSNQEVLDNADIILVSVLPRDVYATIQDLTWQARHVLVCVAIDVTLAGLQRHAPAATVVRAMPSSCLALNRGSTPVFPSHFDAVGLFSAIADVEALDSEKEFETAAAFASAYLWSFALLDVLAERAVDQGLPPTTARRLAATLLEGAAAVVSHAPSVPARATLDRYALPGTMTRQGLDVLTKGKTLSAWGDALDVAIARMRRRDE